MRCDSEMYVAIIMQNPCIEKSYFTFNFKSSEKYRPLRLFPAGMKTAVSSLLLRAYR